MNDNKAVLTEEKYLLLERIKEVEQASSQKSTLIDKLSEDLVVKNSTIEKITTEKNELEMQKTESEKKNSDEIIALKTELESKATVELERDALKQENENLKAEGTVLADVKKSLEERIESVNNELEETKTINHRLRRENFTLKREMTHEVQPYINAVEKINLEKSEKINSLEKLIPSDATLTFLNHCLSDVALDNLLNANPKQDVFSRSELRVNGFPTSILREKEFEKGGLVTTNFHIAPETGTDKFRVIKK